MFVGDRRNKWKDWDENSYRKDGQVRNHEEKGRQVIKGGICANRSETQSVAGREGQDLSGIRRETIQEISRKDRWKAGPGRSQCIASGMIKERR